MVSTKASHAVGGMSEWSLTYRPIEFTPLVHAQVDSSVHPPDADQSHCQAYELKDTWR